jgi:hypothetical protein
VGPLAVVVLNREPDLVVDLFTVVAVKVLMNIITAVDDLTAVVAVEVALP